MFDDTEVDADGRLVVQCEDAPEEAVDLSKPDCLGAVLRHLREEAGVRGVVLVHERERAYGARAMAALQSLLMLARLLDQLGRRVPAPEFPGFSPREVEAVCARCEFRPAAMFGKLRETLLGDPRGFVDGLRTLASSLAAYEEEGCHACTEATLEDLRVLIAETDRPAEG